MQLLTVTGNAEFDGVVGGSEALGRLSVSGTTDINTTAITTSDAHGTGAQTYTGAVTLASDTGLAGSTVTFDSSLNGAHALAITGDASFDNGSTVNVGSLSVSGTTSFDGSLTTSGSQIYSGTVTLATDETLVSTGGDITFGSTVDGAHNLSASATTGTVTFDATVGGGTPLTSLTAEGSNVVVDGSITTAGNTFLQGSGITFAGGLIETMVSSTVSLQADTLTFNGAETVNTGTLEYAPFTAGTAVTLGAGGVLAEHRSHHQRQYAARRRRDGSGHVDARHDGELDHHRRGRFLLAERQSRSRDDGRHQRRCALRREHAVRQCGSVDLTASNLVQNIGDFTATNDFAFTNAFQLGVTGSLTSTNGNITLETVAGGIAFSGNVSASGSGSQILTLRAGDITQTGGTITADELTGSAASVSLTQSGNKVGKLEEFQVGQDFDLSDSVNLTVAGADVSSLGSTGVKSYNGNITLTTSGSLLTVASDMTAYTTGGSQSLSLNSAGSVDQTSGTIQTNILTGSATSGSADFEQITVADQLGAFTTGTGFALHDYVPLTVTGAVSSSTGYVAIETNTGNALTIANGGSLVAAGSGTQVVSLSSGGAITETGTGTIAADELTTFSVGDTLLMGANHVATLEGVVTSGNFSLSDASALTVAGNEVTSAPFAVTFTGIMASSGNIFLESTNASGITFNSGTPPLSLSTPPGPSRFRPMR